MESRSVPYTGQGVQYSLSYADSSARTGATGLTSADIGRIARQVDTGAFYVLTATTPTWSQIGGTSSAIEQGLHTIWMPASAMTARASSPPESATFDSGSNDVTIPVLKFSDTANEYAMFSIRMPKGWDEGVVRASFSWMCQVTGNVVWGIKAVGVTDNESIDAARGTAETIQDAVGSANFYRESGATDDITVLNAAENDLAVFEVYRDAADTTNDTAAGDASLIGVSIFYTINAATDA